MTLSAIILAGNEGANIQNCLDSVAFCDEILVIDDASSDQTVAIARKAGAKVVTRKLNNDFAAQRNFALRQAQGDWVVFVDADEVVTKELQKEIIAETKQSEFVAYYLHRHDILWGHEIKYGEVGNTKLIRLAKRETGRWRRSVHEYWEITGNIGELNSLLMHFPHQSVSEFVSHIDLWSTWHAAENQKEGKKTDLWHIIFWPLGKFFYNYFGKVGFLDGTIGFLAALFMSWHSYLAWSKSWISQNQPR